MIKTVKMYTVVCDNCKQDAFEGHEISCWNNKDFAEDIAIDAEGYIKDGDSHYCMTCAYYDDEDKLIIKSNDSNR
jgi:hypothetical protein